MSVGKRVRWWIYFAWSLLMKGGDGGGAGLCHEGEYGVAEEVEDAVDDAMFEKGHDVALDDAAVVGDAVNEDARQLVELLVGKGRAGEDDVGELGVRCHGAQTDWVG